MAQDHYDVIIIGSGAGGGTLAWKLAPSGKRILLLERGDYLPARARQLGYPGGVPAWQVHDDREVDRRQRQGVHARAELLRRGQHQVLRRRAVSASPARLRRDHAPRRPVPRVAAGLRGSRAVVRRGRGALRRARQSRRGHDRRAAQRRVPVPAGEARAANPAAQRRPGEPGPAPVAPPDRRDARSGRRREHGAHQPVHPLRPGRRVPVPRQRQGRRPDGVRRSHARARQPRSRDERQGRPPRDRCEWTAGHGRRGDHGRRFGSPLLGRCRRLVVRGTELVVAAAALRERRASERAGEPLRPGGAQLHAPQQRRVDGAVERTEPDQFPEDARDERLVPEGRGLGLPVGRHPDARQVGWRAAPREDTAVSRVGQGPRAREQSRDDRAPRRRLLALVGGPAAPRRTGSPSTRATTWCVSTSSRPTPKG